MPRPEVLDNLTDETHPRQRARLPDRGPAAAHAPSRSRPATSISAGCTISRRSWPTGAVGSAAARRPARAGARRRAAALSSSVSLQLLAGERDFSRFPPSRAAERLQAVEHWLAAGRTSRCGATSSGFLHGKAYLFGDRRQPAGRARHLGEPHAARALTTNLELGRLDYNPTPSREAIAWFEQLWGEAAPFD